MRVGYGNKTKAIKLELMNTKRRLRRPVAFTFRQASKAKQDFYFVFKRLAANTFLSKWLEESSILSITQHSVTTSEIDQIL
jgi:hypothetical protein